MKNLALILVSLVMVGCGFSKETLAQLDTEQFECPWIDDLPPTTITTGKGCWCTIAVADAKPTSTLDPASPCDVDELPELYCGADGEAVKVWHKLGAGDRQLPIVELDCADVAGYEQAFAEARTWAGGMIKP